MWFGCGASGRRTGEGVVEKLGETIQGVSEERKVVLVELAPAAKACEVGREMD